MAESREDRNTRITKELWAAMENKDADTYERILRPDAKVWLSGDIIGARTTGNGADQHKSFREVVCNSPQEWGYTVMETTAQDERVAARVRCMTRQPNGKLYDQFFHFLFKFDDEGRIYEWYEHGDTEMITWGLWDGNQPWPPLTDEYRIKRFLSDRAKWPQAEGAKVITEETFATDVKPPVWEEEQQ